MEPDTLLDILHVAERLKCATRHCDTSSGRRESVAEHSWRLTLMAMLLEHDFPDIDMGRVLRMCLIHDLGEAFTGDIPVFAKTAADSTQEDAVLTGWVQTFPEPERAEWLALYAEMEERKTPEARLWKALDKLEAVIQHNESDISSWLPLEYELQLTHGAQDVTFSPVLMRLKETIDRETREKIAAAGNQPSSPACE